ncbi:hypothetical protein GGC47_004947 [Bosea sp. OAE752]
MLLSDRSRQHRKPGSAISSWFIQSPVTVAGATERPWRGPCHRPPRLPTAGT